MALCVSVYRHSHTHRMSVDANVCYWKCSHSKYGKLATVLLVVKWNWEKIVETTTNPIHGSIISCSHYIFLIVFCHTNVFKHPFDLIIEHRGMKLVFGRSRTGMKKSSCPKKKLWQSLRGTLKSVRFFFFLVHWKTMRYVLILIGQYTDKNANQWVERSRFKKRCESIWTCCVLHVTILMCTCRIQSGKTDTRTVHP